MKRKGRLLILLLAISAGILFSGCKQQENEKNTDQYTSDDAAVSDISEVPSSDKSEKPESSSIQISSKPAESSENISKAESSNSQISEKSMTESTVQESVSEPDEESDTGFVDFGGESVDMTLREAYETSKYSGLIENAANQFSDSNYDISVSLSGENTVIVTAVLKENISPDRLNEADTEKYLDSVQSQAGMYIGLLEGATTTKDIRITAELKNPDGTVLAQRTFRREQADDEEQVSKATIEEIAESDMLQSAVSHLRKSFGQEAEISTSAGDDDTLVIEIKLSQTVPQPAQGALAEKLEAYDGDISSVTSAVRILTGNSNAKTVVRLTDGSGSIISERTP